MQKTSERVVGYCSLGGVCETKTKHLREYARFLEHLAETRSPILFSNGGTEPDWCPGKCGDKTRYSANVKVCMKEGLDPEVWLDKKTGRPQIDWNDWCRQQSNGR